MIGEKYGRLTIVSSLNDGNKQHVRVVCSCSCGKIKTALLHHLKSGHTKSCGCLADEKFITMVTKHGHYYEPEYRAWANMIKRCKEPRWATWYSHVKVCKRWLASYSAFLRDVGVKPSASASLDRIDRNKGYSPANVRWTDRSTQSRSTKNHETNKTGVRGVSWSNEKGKWRAAIYVDNKQKHVGYFDDIKDAAIARKAAELKFWGR